MIISSLNISSWSPFIGALAALGLGGFLSFLAIPVVVQVSKAKGLTATPNHRTSHAEPIPSFGGKAIFAGVMLSAGLLMHPVHHPDSVRYILAACLIIFMLGQADDLIGLSWRKKLFVEILAALILVVPGEYRIQSMFGMFGIDRMPFLASTVFTVLVFVAIINAYNLIDGIDGLASGSGILSSFVMGFWLLGIGRNGMAVLAWSLTGALIPFFYFNVFGKKNKLFMGDSGALFIGLLMALFAVVICSTELPENHFLAMKSTPAIAMGILLYPLFDLIRVVIIRLLRGQSPVTADRQHIHHLFLDAGYSHRRSTFYIGLLSLSGIAVAWMFRNSPTLFVGLLLLAYAEAVTLILKVIRRRKASKTVSFAAVSSIPAHSYTDRQPPPSR